MTNKIITFIKIIILILSIINPLAQIKNEKIQFKRINAQDGLSHNNTQVILKDKKGFMWFGTEDGLNRYDGYSIKVYRYDEEIKNSLSSNYIKDILEDSKGRLWIATYGGGLNLYDREKDSFLKFQNSEEDKESINSNYVLDLFEDSKGNLWIGTESGGLNLLVQENFKFKYWVTDSTGSTIGYDDINSIAEDKNGKLWLGFNGGGLSVFDIKNNKFKTYHHNPNDKNSLSSDNVWRVYIDKKNNVWIGTYGGGLNLYIPNQDNFKRFYNDKTNNNSLSCNYIFALNEDNDGRLLIGTESGGLNIFDFKKNKFEHYLYDETDPFSLSHNSVETIYNDDIGTLWVGTFFGGVNYYNKLMFKFNNIKKGQNSRGLNNNFINSMVTDENGLIWIGTDGGGINIFNRNKNTFQYITTYSQKPTISNDIIIKLEKDQENNFWIATYKGGLNYYDRKNNSFKYYTPNSNNPKSLANNIVQALHLDRNGDLWVGNDGLFKFNKSTEDFKIYKNDLSPNSLSYNYVNSIYQDTKKRLWVGTIYGLNRYNASKDNFENYMNIKSDDKSISSDRIYCIFEDKKQRVWIGTEAGLNLYNEKDNSFIKYTEKNGLPNDVINAILEDNKGNLWLATNKGLSKFDVDKNTFVNYDVNDGLQSNIFRRTALKTEDGTLFFGGVNGLNYFHPDSLKTNHNIPKIVITDFLLYNKSILSGIKYDNGYILDKTITETKEIKLNHDQNYLSFVFAALDYIQPEKNKYAYKMIGLEDKWIELGNRRFVDFNLPPGEYLLQVRASNNDGIWNMEGISLKIIILPPFYSTWWFRGLMLLVFFALVYFVYYLRTKAIYEKNIELKANIEERKKIENALRDSEHKYYMLIQESPDAIVAIDKNGCFISFNSTAQKISNVSASEIIGKHFTELKILERYTLQAAIKSFSKIFKTGVGDRIEIKVINSNGKYYILEANPRLIKEQGKDPWLQIMLRDITYRKEVEEERQRLNIELREKNRELEQIIYVSSHDLRTPLINVHGFSKELTYSLEKLLIDLQELAPTVNEKYDANVTEIKESLEYINFNISRMDKLLSGLLKFSRTGRDQLNIVKLDMNNLLKHLSQSFEYQLKAKNINFEINDLPNCKGDEVQLGQVFANLISNAIQYMSTERKGTLKIYGHIEDNIASYIVEDNGIGIAPENQKKIFDIFHRINPEIFVGEGLGLTIVKKILHKHDGTIEVISELGKGSKFIIKLPV